MTRVIAVALAAVLFAPALALAQNPWMTSVKSQHDMIKGNILKSAELIPENLYSFRATPDVRTIAQLFGHIIDATVSICGGAGGVKPAAMGAEKSMTTKAQLVKAAGEAMAMCDKVIAGMDDTKAAETIKGFGGGMWTRGMMIAFNTSHNNEHYGNLVTYMRLNKIVPPSSAGSGD